jgi:ABC-type glycerol-3-phosphate transport system permease component
MSSRSFTALIVIPIYYLVISAFKDTPQIVNQPLAAFEPRPFELRRRAEASSDRARPGVSYW